jgi:hypothetical protein
MVGRLGHWRGPRPGAARCRARRWPASASCPVCPAGERPATSLPQGAFVATPGRPGDWLQFRLQSYAFAHGRRGVDQVLTGHARARGTG